jgi:hypothetical protein
MGGVWNSDSGDKKYIQSFGREPHGKRPLEEEEEEPDRKIAGKMDDTGGWEVDRIVSGSCPMVTGFDVSGDEPSRSPSRVTYFALL